MENHEYKFRVWHHQKEYMYENVAIGLKGKILYARGNPKKRGPDWYVSEEYSENTIIMQYIGLRDDKKKRIYEGDILKIGAGEKLAKVYWSPENSRYELEFLEDGRIIDFADKRSLRNVKIAGNIFENPELTGEEKKAEKTEEKEEEEEEAEE